MDCYNCDYNDYLNVDNKIEMKKKEKYVTWKQMSFWDKLRFVLIAIPIMLIFVLIVIFIYFKLPK